MQHRDAARRALDEGRYLEARDAVAAMQATWPDVEGGSELRAAIERRHSIISVAVGHPATEFDATRLHNWSARRAGRLTERRLTACVAGGSEGGTSGCSLGAVELSAASLTLSSRLTTTSGP